MSDLQVTATVSSFPSGASYNVQQFADAFAQRLIITIPSGNVLFGQIGGTEPSSALAGNGATPGLWWDGTAFRSWSTDSAKYLPIAQVAGNYYNGTLYETTIVGSNATSNTILTLPADKTGTIALTSDLSVVSGTQTLTGTTSSLDWSKKQLSYIVLTGNTTISHINQQDGQIQDLFVENNGTSYTLAVSGTTWANNVAPVVTTASAGTRKIDRLRFVNVGGTTTGALTFGQVLNNKTGNADYVGAAAAYSISSSSDAIPPTVSELGAINKQPYIYIIFNKVLQGATLSTADFIVKKDGVTQTLVSASLSGSMVTIQAPSNLKTTSTWTLQYTGTSIKDLAGNAAAGFGPSTIVISNSIGNEHGGSVGGQ